MTGFSGAPPPERFNIARYCLESARSVRASNSALIIADGRVHSAWTYSRLEEQILSIAGGLCRAGFDRGDRLLLRLGNGLDYVLMFFGSLAAGMVPIPASSLLSEAEIAFMVRDARPRAVVIDARLSLPPLPPEVRIIAEPELARLKAAAPSDYCDTLKDDPAFIVYTSGTSGTPKGVIHAQRAAWGRRPMYRGWYAIDSGDVVLHTSDLNWTYSMGTGFIDPWANGASCVLYTGARAIEVWPDLVARHSVSILASTPAIYRRLLKYCDVTVLKNGRLRHGLSAGESLSTEIHRLWQEKTGTAIYEAFGMSEISTFISASPGNPAKPGSCGRPQAGRCVSILPAEGGSEPMPAGSVGLIAVHRSDPGLMLGYVSATIEETDCIRGEWFLGGDLGHMDEGGNVWFDGRSDDTMNAMGFRVAPEEVEAALEAHPAIAEAGVCELKVRFDISVIAGFIVIKEGHTLEKEALLSFLRRRLAAYKIPKEIVFLGELPRTATGKLVRRLLPGLAVAPSRHEI